MTRESNSPGGRPVRRPIRGLAASILVAIRLCPTASAQDPAPDPPPLSPLPAGLSGLMKDSDPSLGAARHVVEARRLASMAGSKNPDLLREALAEIDRALTLDPGHIDARYVRGRLLAWYDRPEAALGDLSWVIERRPDHFRALVARARILSGRRELDHALIDLDRASSARPDLVDSDFLTLRGWCHAATGEYERALADYTRAIEEDAGRVEAWIYRARCDIEMEEPERARSDVEEFLRLRPDDLSAHFLRYTIHLQVEDYGAAIAEATRLIHLLPDQPGPYLLRCGSAWVWAREQDRHLAEVERIANQVEPILPCAWLLSLARSLTAGVGQRIALADLDRCLAIEPRLSLPYALRAIHEANRGRFVPTCEDLAAFLWTFDPLEYSVRIGVTDWDGPLFHWEVSWKWRSGTARRDKEVDASDPNREFIDAAFRYLLASAFGSTR